MTIGRRVTVLASSLIGFSVVLGIVVLLNLSRMERGLAEAGADGKSKVDDVATAIHSITGDAGQVKVLVEEVNLSSQEQTRGIDQVSKATNQMEQVTQRTAASAEESAAAGQLTAQARTLRDVVTRLEALAG